MGLTPTAAADRYRTRNRAPADAPALPQDNLLWRAPKVPLRRQDASVQLELIDPDEQGPRLPAGLPDRDRLLQERIERTIQETLTHLRPQVNRAVRDIEMQLMVADVPRAQHHVVEDALKLLEAHLREFAATGYAHKTWATLGRTD